MSSSCLLVLVIFIAFTNGEGKVEFPIWSWDTLQSMTFFQGCNATGTDIAFNQTMLDIITRYNVITIEKGQGQNSDLPGWFAEDYMLAAAKQIKSINPEIHIGFYLNSVLDWTQYRLHQQFMEHKEWWLRNQNGTLIRMRGDHHFANYTDLLNFDISNPEMADLWSSTCLNMIDSSYFESCTIDRVYQWGASYKGNNTLDPQKIALFNLTKQKTLVSMQRHLNLSQHGGPLYINNGFHIPGVNGFCLEGFQPIEDDILMLSNRSDDEQLAIHVHGGYNLSEGCSGQSFIDVLAAYLIGVEKYQYFACNQVWIGGDGNWHKEYEYPLGEPKGKSVKVDGIYYRSFGSGTSVTFDTSNNSGNIYWSHLYSIKFLKELDMRFSGGNRKNMIE